MMSRDIDARKPLPQVVLVASLVACAPEPGDPFVPILESEHLRIGTSFGGRPCMGFVDMWEAQVEALEETLGVSRDFAWLYLYSNGELEHIAEDCGYTPPALLFGCWDDPVVRSTLSRIPHELVHAWAATANPDALPVLHEGIAERMSGAVPRYRWDALEVHELLFTAPPASDSKASHFIAWLMDTFGAETFMKLYTSTTRGMSEAELTTAVENVLDMTPSELVLAYGTSSRDYYPAMGGAACGRAAATPWRDGAASWPADGSCEDGPFLGYENSSERWHVVTIEVAIPGQYVLDVGGRQAAMTRCLTAPADAEQLPTLHSWLSGDWQHVGALASQTRVKVGWENQVLDLDAGTYEVWVERSQDTLESASDMALFRL